MDEQLKAKIAVKLREGVSGKKILDEIRDNVHNVIGREHQVTIQDIQNICCQYNIEGIQHHQLEMISRVDTWVQEMSSQTSNPVLLYKTQVVIKQMKLITFKQNFRRILQ